MFGDMKPPTTSPEPPLEPREVDGTYVETVVICSVVQILIIFIGGMANVVVICTTIYARRFTSNFDLLIFTLALADVLVCGVITPMTLFSMHAEMRHPKQYCLSLVFIGVLGGMVSLATLCAIAVHRHAMVVWHPKQKATKTTSFLILSTLLCIGVALATLVTLRLRGLWVDKYGHCAVVTKQTTHFGDDIFLSYLGPVFLLSIATVIACYCWVAHVVRKQTRKTTKTPINTESVGYKSKAIPVTQYTMNKETKALKTCFVVTIVLICCWAPIFITQILEKIINCPSETLLQIKIGSLTLLLLNSALNPFIYAINSTTLKQRASKFKHKLCFILGCVRLKSRTVETKVRAIGQESVDETEDQSTFDDTSTYTSFGILSPRECRRQLQTVGANPVGASIAPFKPKGGDAHNEGDETKLFYALPR
ncbi:probable G-protein coupled receptor 75 [Ptychodera flava]|uniref:probable G-protein coupled receptor 75 n=1 Tax=Ptychodera flava TaxID=63121 RepID=UPI00396A5D9A